MTIQTEYQKKRESIELNRALDWSTFGVEYTAAGEKLNPMTVQTWFDLLAIKSPLIVAEIPSVDSIVDYIWRCSKRHTESRLIKNWRLWRIYKRVIKELTNVATAESLVEVVIEHVRTNLDEFPLSAGNCGSKTTNSMLEYSGEASMIDEIAHRYSMHPDEVLKMPLRKAFSLQRIIRMATIPDHKILEPESLRAIKSQYLDQLNNGQ